MACFQISNSVNVTQLPVALGNLLGPSQGCIEEMYLTLKSNINRQHFFTVLASLIPLSVSVSVFPNASQNWIAASNFTSPFDVILFKFLFGINGIAKLAVSHSKVKLFCCCLQKMMS